MPDATPTPEVPKTPETPTPDPVEAERAARQLAEQRAAWAEGAATASQEALRAAAASRQNEPVVQEDYLGKAVGEDITATPEERKRALDNYLAQQRMQTEARMRQETDARLAADRQAMGFEMAVNTVVGRRPELNDPKNSPNFRAAMTKAKAEADQRGEGLTPLQLLQRAEQVYDTVFAPKAAPNVPFVEGAQRPDLGAAMATPQGAPQQSQIEELYGMEAGKIGQLPRMGSADMDAEIDNYIKQRNKPLMDRGINTGLKSIRFYKD